MSSVSPEPNTGCWLYTPAPEGDYGTMYVEGRRMTSHRAAWTILVGPVPQGVEVCHRCDVDGIGKGCVNPDHLFLGTHADNMADLAAKGRGTNQWANRSACSKWHAYTPENTMRIGTRRICRQCQNARLRATRALARLRRSSGGKP
jgi:hypothetical protein